MSIKWMKDGGELHASDELRMSVSGEMLTLEVADSMVDDSGEYKCVVTSGSTKVWTSCNLIVDPIKGMRDI
jgi:hypothetical protein